MTENNKTRLDWIQTRFGNRYWWFRRSGNKYLPAIFQILTDEQWSLLQEWYEYTDAHWQGAEVNIPAMSTILGMIDGNNLDKIVQLGTSHGWSTLMIGWALQRMGKNNALITFDINQTASDFAEKYVKKAGLQDVVAVRTIKKYNKGDHTGMALGYLGSAPKMIFIDSSHNYQETLDELYLWAKVLRSGGVFVLHDVSKFATRYDSTGSGGVHRAITEWIKEHHDTAILINQHIVGNDNDILTMQDGCGLGIMQLR